MLLESRDEHACVDENAFNRARHCHCSVAHQPEKATRSQKTHIKDLLEQEPSKIFLKRDGLLKKSWSCNVSYLISFSCFTN